MPAFSIAEPVLDAESEMYDTAVEHAKVTSDVNVLPFCQGMRAFGLFQSVHNSPVDSSTAGITD